MAGWFKDFYKKKMSEIEGIYDIICKFEEVSGLKMHRDITRDTRLGS